MAGEEGTTWGGNAAELQLDFACSEVIHVRDLGERQGRGDGWITDRTGLLTASQRARYARAARTLADLSYGPFPDISDAVPECYAAAVVGPGPDGLPEHLIAATVSRAYGRSEVST